MYNCVCCNLEANRTILVPEMMFGTKEIFKYVICDNCSHLHLLNVPEHISKYYNNNYYSLGKDYHEWKGDPNNTKTQYFKKYLIRKLLKFYFKGYISDHSFLQKYIAKIPEYRFFPDLKLKKEKIVLDVGCGNGWLIRFLHSLGFENSFGIDPFIHDNVYINDKMIVKKSDNLNYFNNPSYDIIIFNHSIEHIKSFQETLYDVNHLLSNRGTCIIRTPIADSKAFEKYKEYWVQLDAPRHINIFSKRSLKIACSKANLYIDKIIFDSSAFQFWGSELYKMGISLQESFFNPNNYFNNSTIQEFITQAANLNENSEGDQAIFYVKKKS